MDVTQSFVSMIFSSFFQAARQIKFFQNLLSDLQKQQ